MRVDSTLVGIHPDRADELIQESVDRIKEVINSQALEAAEWLPFNVAVSECGTMLRCHGRAMEADNLEEESISFARNRDKYTTITLMFSMAHRRQDDANFDAAERLLRESWQLTKTLTGKRPDHIANMFSSIARDLGDCLVALGKKKGLDELLKLVSALPSENTQVRETAEQIGRLNDALQKLEEPEQLTLRLHGRALVLFNAGRFTRAARLFEEEAKVWGELGQNAPLDGLGLAESYWCGECTGESR